MTGRRRLPIGAEIVGDDAVEFRVWAPRRSSVVVVVQETIDHPDSSHALEKERDGYFALRVPGVPAGALYRFRLDDDPTLYPDPASRFQPFGPHGHSQIVDPNAYAWSDHGWRGVSIEGQVLYEMHIGTFTREGTWSAAERELPALADLGVTVLEIMPVAEFAGRFGWGYDGVDLYAPTHLYGTPDEFRHFVDRAHALGLAVILDVVYNHLGPAGNYLSAFSSSYFSDRYENEWGDPINFDGRDSGPVREFFVGNAAYWIDEFHLDGLRLDATQQIFDASEEHVVAEITRRARSAAGDRQVLIIAENEPQECRLVRPVASDGMGLDAVWNDDFHHAACVALTGRREAYYNDYLGTPQELVSTAKHGFLFQGQYYAWQGKRRGTSTAGIPGHAFVTYLQNHDQVANSRSGSRIHTRSSPGKYRAMTALLLLGPGTPLLFQGQEFAASAPFLYFADHEPELAEAVRRGRFEFLRQFPSVGADAELDDPSAYETFARSILDGRERRSHAAAHALHRDLIRLRREDSVVRRQGVDGIDGAVLTASALVLRYFGGGGDDRLLVVNLGRDLKLSPAPEPLLAPPDGREWRVAWSSEAPEYDGSGAPALERPDGWVIPGECAALFAPMAPTGGEQSSETNRDQR